MKFLMIARLLYDKGFSQYVESASEIRSRYPDVEFILVGDFDFPHPNHVQREEVMKYHDAGIINYLGYQKDIYPIIKSVDCIVHPTYYPEGLSRVLMEAISMGKPVITTNISGCRETIKNNENGFLIPPRDTEALTDALDRFIKLSSSERNMMGERGRKYAEERFDIKHVISLYKKIIKEAVNK